MNNNNNNIQKNILFIDAESASLREEIFAVALIGFNGEVLFNGYYNHKEMQDPTSWVAQNVKLTGTEFATREEFLNAFLAAFEAAREKYGFGDYKSLAVCGHMPVPVEANLFQQLYEEAGMGEFSGPYHMFNTDTLLLVAGEKPDSEQAYAEKHGLELPEGYVPHSALSDAQLTRLVWLDLTEKLVK